jgi:hypothetical protein
MGEVILLLQEDEAEVQSLELVFENAGLHQKVKVVTDINEVIRSIRPRNSAPEPKSTKAQNRTFGANKRDNST